LQEWTRSADTFACASLAFAAATDNRFSLRHHLGDTGTLFALLQVLWLLIECASRKHGLYITQLEAVALTLAFVDVLILIFTWQRPLDARHPVSINAKVNLPRSARFTSIRGDFEREQILEEVFPGSKSPGAGITRNQYPSVILSIVASVSFSFGQ